MKLTTIFTLLSALTATAVAGTVPPIVCDQGYIPGKICISDCKSPGLYVPKVGNLIKSISLPSFALTFDSKSPQKAVASSKGVQVELGIPKWLGFLGSNFIGAGAVIGVGIPGGASVGTLVSPDYQPASGTISGGVVSLDINNADLKVNDAAGFADFLAGTLLKSGPVTLRLNGYADNKADIINDPFNAHTCLNYVAFDLTSSTLSGLGGLKETIITDIPKIVSGDPAKGIALSIPLSIKNPSNIALNLKNSNVNLDLTFDGQKVGVVTLPNLSLQSGANTVQATALVTPPTSAVGAQAVKKLFSQFTGGVVSNVSVGNGKAEGLSVLDKALGALNIPQVLPAQKQPLVNAAKADGQTLTYLDADGFVISMNSTLDAANPFDVPVTIVKIDATLSYQGVECVTVSAPISGFSIPPKGSAISPAFPIIINTKDKPACDEFVNQQLTGGTSHLELKSTLTLAVDRFGSQIDYVQQGVSVTTTF
ncbi:hypothetical protein HDU97_009044 [Phlyctochytrium planicorne]|nr:hypothetical protein HDU97_009044 [Phlyctochytrium planicorne]